MNKEKLKVLYMLWVLIVILEIFWMYNVVNRPYTSSDLAYVITVIAATLVIGSVGLNLFAKSIEYDTGSRRG